MQQDFTDDPLHCLTVGPADADVVGTDQRAIQIAVDALALRGGGVVRLLPGEYELIDAVRLRSNIGLIGSPGRVLLRRGPAPLSPLVEDADIGEKQVRPRHPDGFRVGMGVMFRCGSQTGGTQTMPLFITAIRDGVLHLNDYIPADFSAEAGAELIGYTPLIHGFEAEHVRIEGLRLDGRPPHAPAELAGVWGGNIYLRRCHNSTLREIDSSGCYGDGIRIGQTRNILIERCRCHDNTEYGLHAGSHSTRVVVRQCEIDANGSDGLYICWGIRHSRFEHNHLHHNGHRKHRSGLAIGHKDTDNLIAHNHIHDNHKHGICFREKTAANGAHRNRVIANRIENNGVPWEQVPPWLHHLPRQSLMGAGIYVNGITHDLLFEGNQVCETRRAEQRHQRVGFYFAPGTDRIEMRDNRIHGHPDHDVLDHRTV